VVAGTSLTIGDIGKIHRDFRKQDAGRSGASVGIADFSRRWQGGAEKLDMARKCHRQGAGVILFSSVSSSGGGLPGRPGLERVWGARYFFGVIFFAA
jgi:hypothetical protein